MKRGWKIFWIVCAVCAGIGLVCCSIAFIMGVTVEAIENRYPNGFGFVGRIDSYDGDFVTFHYNRHEDDAYVEETLPVMEFIERLIRHIPEKHFKMIRYGGIYARHREIDKKLYRIISREKHRIFRSFNQWRTAILSAFGYDPLKCECGTTMLFLELYFNHKRVSLEELYEKVMSRSRGKRSSA